MRKLDFLNELTEKLTAALPNNLRSLQKDLAKNFQLILQSAFSKLDLVTREEFDAQTKVLARSRKRIEMLEAKLLELEKIQAAKDS